MIATINEYEMKVMDWINANFDVSSVVVVDFKVLPYGKRIVDRNGEEMAVFFDYFRNEVKTFFPE
ncbi:hypothetical protein [Bacillus sp. SJS]|uniref:hypothetical protein n=1 Tax=Bacillus sp. SJS TaxID=1423321 RepID=UPI0006919D66|nr:hypothetical protein [Bacillus sp. SJS]KZZ85652.1 hypothetical protein AS29_003425 [Bacillus sp. SJS]